MDLDDGSNDPKYKHFNDDLNAVLSAFSKSVEWADLVKWLGKFSRVFEKYPKSTCIQQKLLLAKRLSQCLNPSLPSGCHSQTLDTYELIFHRIGQEKLAKDISIYSNGLFPLFRHASTDVRFKILSLYEKFLLPLGHRLHSCLVGVVSSLLPGLEEGNGEMYEAVRKQLESIQKSTSTTLFFQAIWKTMVTTSYNRQSAIDYLLKHLPKNFEDVSLQVTFLPEKDSLVAQALYESLLDPLTLVQRSTLELITGFFPINIKIFNEEALYNIIMAAVKVVVHRDASLNKRLNSWLLGKEKDKDSASNNSGNYFVNYGKQPTTKAFKKLLGDVLNPIDLNIQHLQQQTQQLQQKKVKEMTSVFQILSSLFQKEDFQAILDGILLDILRCLYKYKEGYPFSKEIVRYIDELFGSITEHSLVWDFLNQLLSYNESTSISDAIENVKLVETLLDVIPLSIEEVQTKFLPSLLLSIIRSMRYVMASKDNQLVISYTQMCLRLIGKIIVDSNFNNSSNNSNNNSSTTSNFSHINPLIDCIDTFQDYFIILCSYVNDNLSQLNPPPVNTYPVVSSPGNVSPILLSSSSAQSIIQQQITTTSFAFVTNSDIFIILDLSLQVLVGLVQQFRTSPGGASPASSPLLESSMPKWFLPIFNFCMSDNPFISCLAIKSFISLANKHGENNLSRSFRSIITTNHFTQLAKKLWAMLEPNNCSVHYKVASLYLSLREMNEEACSSVIAEAMLDPNLNNRVEGYQKFALFWRLTGELGNNSVPFSNTLFLMLDSLNDEQPIIRLTGHTWLADSISKAERILDPLLKILLDKSTIRFNHIYQSMYDARRVIYAFKVLKGIIECDFKMFIHHVIEKPISKDILQLNEAQSLNFRETPKTAGPNYAGKKPNSKDDSHVTPMASAPYIFTNYSSAPSTPNGPNAATNAAGSTETSSDFLFIPTNSYIDLLVVVALRFLQGMVPTSIDQSTKEGQSFVSQNDVVQICAAEFLQYLLNQTSIQPQKANEIANYIQEPILQNLAQAVSSSNMVLQVHLLSLLRSIVLIDSSPTTLPSSPSWSGFSGTLDSSTNNSMGNTSLNSITQSTMFLQTTVVGIIQPSSRFNIRFYWLDFITFCLPRMANSAQLPHVVMTIINCMRDLIMSFDSRSLYDSLTARDIIVLLKSLTFILKFSVLEPITPFDRVTNDEQSNNNRSGALGGVRLLTDFVKDVFTSDIDPSTTLTPIGKVKEEILRELSTILTPLLKIWGPPKSTNSKMSMSTDVSSDTHNKFAIQDLITHIMDPFMTKYPTQFLGAVIDVWQRTDLNTLESINTRKVIMEILNSLESVRDETIFQSLYQILSSLHIQERAKPPKSVIHKITLKESALYDFAYRYIEDYTSLFDGITTTFLAFVRESLHSSNPMTFVSQLQILNLYIKKMSGEEKSKYPMKYKNNKRDLQDLIPKIVEACFMISGKSFNDISAMYIPPTAGSVDHSPSRPPSIDTRNTDPSSLPPSMLQTPPSAYTSAGTSIGEDNSARGRSSSGGEHDSGNILKREASRLKTQVSLKSLVHLSTTLSALLDTIFDDKERIATILANSLHNVVPYLKSKVDVNRENTYYATCLFSSLSEYSYNIKSIKKDALELFFDSDFFKADIKTLEQSGKIINQIMNNDKTALSDFIKILSKTWTPPSALMFVNKETEYMNRAKQLKRLSFILWSGLENQHLTMLPLVLEKIVESLRIPNATVLHLQVFFCLRVLLVRISHENLRSFWPIILSELTDILSHADNGELVLASCKFLDLALTLPSITEQFNLFEWVFIRDCFIKQQEAPFVPFIDSIAQNPVKYDEDNLSPFVSLTASGVFEQNNSNQLLRPCIMIRSIADLPNGYAEFKSFLATFSSTIYRRHLCNSAIDYQFINEQLSYDFSEFDATKIGIGSDWVSLNQITNQLNSDKRNSLEHSLTLNQTTSTSESTPTEPETSPTWQRTSHTSNPSSGGFKSTATNFLERSRNPSLSLSSSSEHPTLSPSLSSSRNDELNEQQPQQ